MPGVQAPIEAPVAYLRRAHYPLELAHYRHRPGESCRREGAPNTREKRDLRPVAEPSISGRGAGALLFMLSGDQCKQPRDPLMVLLCSQVRPCSETEDQKLGLFNVSLIGTGNFRSMP